MSAKYLLIAATVVLLLLAGAYHSRMEEQWFDTGRGTLIHEWSVWGWHLATREYNAFADEDLLTLHREQMKKGRYQPRKMFIYRLSNMGGLVGSSNVISLPYIHLVRGMAKVEMDAGTKQAWVAEGLACLYGRGGRARLQEMYKELEQMPLLGSGKQ